MKRRSQQKLIAPAVTKLSQRGSALCPQERGGLNINPKALISFMQQNHRVADAQHVLAK